MIILIGHGSMTNGTAMAKNISVSLRRKRPSEVTGKEHPPRRDLQRLAEA